MESLSGAAGTYALILSLPRGQSLWIGRLGPFEFAAGYYVYVGSACGPGGLAGRLRHHLAPAARPHWHVDYLRRAARLEAVWLAAQPGREHAWAVLMLQLAGATLPAPRFGASDCACPAHLGYLPARPRLEEFRRLLAAYFPGDAPVQTLGPAGQALSARSSSRPGGPVSPPR